jgi:hypothetical protein
MPQRRQTDIPAGTTGAIAVLSSSKTCFRQRWAKAVTAVAEWERPVVSVFAGRPPVIFATDHPSRSPVRKTR